MLIQKVGSGRGKYLRMIASAEYFVDGTDTKVNAHDIGGYFILSPDQIVEANFDEVVRMFPMADESRWYKWKEEG